MPILILTKLFNRRLFKKIFFKRGRAENKFAVIYKLLPLKKPLVIFSLETTGPSVSSDKIIGLAYIKIMTNGRVIEGNYYLNPKTDISPESVSIHGLSAKYLGGMPTFRQKASELWDIFNGCFYGGFNIVNFDLPLLRREFIRVGMRFEYSQNDIIDSKAIFNYLEPPTFSVAYNYYCQKEYLNEHRSGEDVNAGVEILEKQLLKYEEIRDWKFVNKIHSLYDDHLSGHKRKFYWKNGQAYFIFSKYRDKALAEVAVIDPGFLKWILKANFSDETKELVRKALSERKDK